MKRINPNKIQGRRDLPRLGGRATQRHNTQAARKTAKQRWKRDVDTQIR